jgi:serine/threonine protein kinase
MAQAVNYIHNIGLVHLDLKLTNFLVDPNDNVLLADFFVAIFSSYGSSEVTGNKFRGTIPFMSPEMLKMSLKPGLFYDAKACHMCYLGVCLFVLMNKKYPFDIFTVSWSHIE